MYVCYSTPQSLWWLKAHIMDGIKKTNPCSHPTGVVPLPISNHLSGLNNKWPPYLVIFLWACYAIYPLHNTKMHTFRRASDEMKPRKTLIFMFLGYGCTSLWEWGNQQIIFTKSQMLSFASYNAMVIVIMKQNSKLGDWSIISRIILSDYFHFLEYVLEPPEPEIHIFPKKLCLNNLYAYCLILKKL